MGQETRKKEEKRRQTAKIRNLVLNVLQNTFVDDF